MAGIGDVAVGPGWKAATRVPGRRYAGPVRRSTAGVAPHPGTCVRRVTHEVGRVPAGLVFGVCAAGLPGGDADLRHRTLLPDPVCRGPAGAGSDVKPPAARPLL